MDNRRLILENIKTTLTAIDGTGSYETAVGRVDRWFKTWSEINEGSTLPIIGISAGKTTFQYQPTGQMRAVFAVVLWCHLRGTDEVTRLETADKLFDDIVYALSLDARRGGYAVSTTVAAVETNEADLERGDSLTMRVDLEIVYRRTTGKS